MNLHITPGFRKLLAALPDDVHPQARSAYRQFKENPRHPGLGFKQIHGSDRLVSVRISRGTAPWVSGDRLTKSFGSGLGPTKNMKGFSQNDEAPNKTHAPGAQKTAQRVEHNLSALGKAY